MVSRHVAAVLVSLLAVLSVQGQPKPEKERLKPQAPEDSMRKLVAALVEKDAWQAEQAFMSKARYTNTLPPKVPPYAQSLLRFRQSIKQFLAQPQPIEKMAFVRVSYEFCAQPMIAQKGFKGFRQMCVMYDNLHVIVRIEGALYSFKVDSLVADDDKWALVEGIELLKPYGN